MKRIKHKLIEQDFLFDREKYVSLAIENPIFFREFLEGLLAQANGDTEDYIVYEKNGKLAELKKDALIIVSPFAEFIDEKKDAAAIQKSISSHLSQDQKETYSKIVSDILKFVEDLSYETHLPLAVDSDIPVTSFLKTISLRPELSYDTFFERLISRIRTGCIVEGKSLVILVNAQSYLTEEEIENLYREVSLLDSDLFLISSSMQKQVSESEQRILIDSDLCEI